MKTMIICTSFALLLPLGLAGQSQIFATDFESDFVGATTAANPSDVAGFRGNFPAAIVRDSSDVAPFGPGNQYLQFGGDGVSLFDGTNYSARAIVTGAPSSAYLDTVLGISFKFHETTPNSWGTHIGVGTGANPWQPELNAGAGMFALSFRDGAVTLGANTAVASGDLPAYSKGQNYEIIYYMNWTGAAETVPAPDGSMLTLDNKQIGFWMRDLGSDTLTGTVVLNSSFGDPSDSISLVFRNFSSTLANQNVVYIDDLAFTVIPEPSTYAALLGLGVLALALARRRARGA